MIIPRNTNTEKKVENALLDIILDTKYGDIYIKDICEKAGINRSTFYVHYEDINDLIIKTESRLTKELTNQLSTFKENELDYFEKIYQFLNDNQNFYRTYLLINQTKYNKIDTILNNVNSKLTQKYQVNDIELSYQMTFFIDGFKSITKRWLILGCKENAQSIAKFAYNAFINLNKIKF